MPDLDALRKRLAAEHTWGRKQQAVEIGRFAAFKLLRITPTPEQQDKFERCFMHRETIAAIVKNSDGKNVGIIPIVMRVSNAFLLGKHVFIPNSMMQFHPFLQSHVLLPVFAVMPPEEPSMSRFTKLMIPGWLPVFKARNAAQAMRTETDRGQPVVSWPVRRLMPLETLVAFAVRNRIDPPPPDQPAWALI